MIGGKLYNLNWPRAPFDLKHLNTKISIAKGDSVVWEGCTLVLLTRPVVGLPNGKTVNSPFGQQIKLVVRARASDRDGTRWFLVWEVAAKRGEEPAALSAHCWERLTFACTAQLQSDAERKPNVRLLT